VRRFSARFLRAGAGPIAALAVVGTLCVGGGRSATQLTPVGAPARVIVTTTGGTAGAQQLVERAGGQVRQLLPVVDGFAATVPPGALPRLRALPGVRSVTPDAAGHVMSVDPALGYDPVTDEGSLSFVTKMLHTQDAWKGGWTGKGVDVALVDTGVARVPGLTSGNVVDGPDLSFEAQHADVRYQDTFGHGTHMASIIAGRDTVRTAASYPTAGDFDGVAPDARIINIKVAASDGSADVSQVIAAIGWVTQHAHDYGLNIRVLNLSYGTDSTQSYALDPLAYAAEQAWRHGIVVVVAAGNDGTTRQQLADPAIDPYVIAAGAEDANNTQAAGDDTVPAFAQRGTTARHVDVVAPGVHVLGLRDPNSYIDQAWPSARVGTRFFRGSGTSQATAVVSGVTALLLQKNPTATPDQIKSMLMATANKFPAAKDTWQGTGLVDANKALGMKPTSAPVQVQQYAAGAGTGTLEGARGSSHVTLGGAALSGERDIFGATWNATPWTTAAASNTLWSAGSYNGVTWTGTGWDTNGDWTAAPWTAPDWTGTSWDSRTWVSRTWVAGSWDSRTWVSTAWTGTAWTARTWVDDGWADAAWA
jgi:serine protease AprX